ncbi:MAG: acyl carrier protein, partial [Clostridia bacterium]
AKLSNSWSARKILPFPNNHADDIPYIPKLMIQKEDETMVLDKVCEMIASQLQVDPSIVKRESRLVEDLKADSANVMVMILELESEFGIEVEDEVILKLKTVGDVADYIEKHQ